MGRGTLIGILLAVCLSGTASADQFMSKATGLQISEPLTVSRALRAAKAIGGYDTVFMVERLSDRRIRLTVCKQWWDIYIDDKYAGQTCGDYERVTIRLIKGHVNIWQKGHPWPTPD